MDIGPGNGLTILGGALLSKDLLIKLLGPTAEYLGRELRNYTEKGAENLRRIFGHAIKTLGVKLENPGQVPAKVLKGILAEGFYCEDELTAQYFGGVMASSRSGVSRDDRGASFTALIGRLSTYQIRTHFIFYSIFKILCNGRKEDLNFRENLLKFRIFIPSPSYIKAIDLQEGEDLNVLMPHILDGLCRETLLCPTWAMGDPKPITRLLKIPVESPGIAFIPAPVGLELYLWAHGLSTVPVGNFLSADFHPMQLEGIQLPEDSKFIYIA